jgi:hypothetical protein
LGENFNIRELNGYLRSEVYFEQGTLMQERSHKHLHGAILCLLADRDVIARGLLRQQLRIKQDDLGIILDDLEHAGKIKRLKLRNGKYDTPCELIALRRIQKLEQTSKQADALAIKL